LSYGALKRRFDLDDAYIEDIKGELIKAERVAVDENGEVLVWTGTNAEGEKAKGRKTDTGEGSGPHTRDAGLNAAERRQLTVLFCDLVGSTALSAQLDPEDYRTLVQQYQQICTEVIQRHEGYLAQYLGDGLLVYFGYPTAHEDDARRAVRTGLEIVKALQSRVRQQAAKDPLSDAFQVRIGIHTGLVVVGEIGGNEKRELLALGETPNIAARIQGLAEPNTVIISAATQRLIDGQFESQPFGSHLLKGIDTPIAVYHVQSERQNVTPLTGRISLTPLVGREQEVGLLFDRWEQVKEGRGQVVLLSGEPGIGKSRLAYRLREHVTAEGSLLFEARCSPYHQHSAFYPLIDVLQRTLLFTRQDTDHEKGEKLERTLALYNLQDSLPLFAALLSLPTPSQYPQLNLTPQKQKERTLQILLQLLTAQAERQATVSVWEDLHWVDPSSLEFLSLLIEQIPTTKLLLVLTFRPEFTPSWKPRSHISQLVLNRLGKKQVEAMIEKVAIDKALSAEVIEQIRIKTDGVPLFVEELTKSVVESVEGQGSGAGGRDGKPEAVLAIPATLQEALLARLDRLETARQVAQLGATLGREFSYELLQAVTPLSEPDLQTGLAKLVEAEILYQRGIGEKARYFFKHALIQDTAYQSLLKSTRQQYHRQIAQVLEERFPQTKETQPELLAHHYTEAGKIERAIPYWQNAGQKAGQRSANVEAITHLTKGLELLKILPDTSERAYQELHIHMALGAPLIATKGFASRELKQTFEHARELCQKLGETSELFGVSVGLWLFHITNEQSPLQTARMLAEQSLRLAQDRNDTTRLQIAHVLMANTLFIIGELPTTRKHCEQAMALHDVARHVSIDQIGIDSRTAALSYASFTLWLLGFPDQALKLNIETITRAQELAQPFNLAIWLELSALFHVLRGEERVTQERTEAAMGLSAERGFPDHLEWGTMNQGWVHGKQGNYESAIKLLRKGLSGSLVSGFVVWTPFYLGLLAELYGKIGQAEEGLSTLAEARERSNKKGTHWCEAELYRLKGQLMQQSLSILNTQYLTPSTYAEVEECYLNAIDIAQKQQAKSWELRAAMSLARLWQQQDKKAEAHKLLSDVYNWFTEGFDTKDLQEAKALLDSLGSGV
jgi:class 3 adenylate cyclase/predicted ATPase